MCAVSELHTYMDTRVPRESWTRETFNDYLSIIGSLGKLDRELDQSDCDDSSKAAWMEDVENRLRKLGV